MAAAVQHYVDCRPCELFKFSWPKLKVSTFFNVLLEAKREVAAIEKDPAIKEAHLKVLFLGVISPPGEEFKSFGCVKVRESRTILEVWADMTKTPIANLEKKKLEQLAVRVRCTYVGDTNLSYWSNDETEE